MSLLRLHIPHRQRRTFHDLATSFQHHSNSLSSVPHIKKAAAVAPLKVPPSSLTITRLLTSKASQRALSQTFRQPPTVLRPRLRLNALPPFSIRRTFSTSSPKMVVTVLADSKSFDTFVKDATADTLVVIDCFATWCGPCKAMTPVVEQYSKAYPKALFFKLDVDEVPDVAQELGIRAMPTFLLYKNGEKIAEVVGANPAGLKNNIEKHL